MNNIQLQTSHPTMDAEEELIAEVDQKNEILSDHVQGEEGTSKENEDRCINDECTEEDERNVSPSDNAG